MHPPAAVHVNLEPRASPLHAWQQANSELLQGILKKGFRALGGGGGAGSRPLEEGPQHLWLKLIPHNALIILRYVSRGNFFEKILLGRFAMQVVSHHSTF